MHFLALPRKQKFRKYGSTKPAEMLRNKNPIEPYIFCKTSVEVFSVKIDFSREYLAYWAQFFRDLLVIFVITLQYSGDSFFIA